MHARLLLQLSPGHPDYIRGGGGRITREYGPQWGNAMLLVVYKRWSLGAEAKPGEGEIMYLAANNNNNIL